MTDHAATVARLEADAELLEARLKVARAERNLADDNYRILSTGHKITDEELARYATLADEAAARYAELEAEAAILTRDLAAARYAAATDTDTDQEGPTP